ncbi:MAG TPA: hypothetical protein VMT37_10720 [Solirubrobacterales bacterium]|nr:hypothetical protein [Solirubrobacterales bacterium]
MASLVVAALAITAAPALAAGSAATASSSTTTASGCSDDALGNPFARFGDNANYAPLPGGSFEQGNGGWSLSGSSVASGNESYGVAGGSKSLAIQPGGEAVSPAFCVDVAHPTLRFFARQTSGSWAVLNVILRWTDAKGAIHDTTVGSLQSGTSWKPTPIMALGTTLPLWQNGETLSVRLVLKPEAYGGAWAVDDVFADPRMR